MVMRLCAAWVQDVIRQLQLPPAAKCSTDPPRWFLGDLIMAEQQVCQTNADEERGLQEERAAWLGGY